MEIFRNDSAHMILRVLTIDIPGNLQDRQNTIARMFCKQVLNCLFNREIQVSKYDYSHVTPDFDSNTPVRRWFIYDLNVTHPLTRQEILSLAHVVYQVSQQGNKWYVSGTITHYDLIWLSRFFIVKERWVENVKQYCNIYHWGGKLEQEKVAQMRKI